MKRITREYVKVDRVACPRSSSTPPLNFPFYRATPAGRRSIDPVIAKRHSDFQPLDHHAHCTNRRRVFSVELRRFGRQIRALNLFIVRYLTG